MKGKQNSALDEDKPSRVTQIISSPVKSAHCLAFSPVSWQMHWPDGNRLNAEIVKFGFFGGPYWPAALKLQATAQRCYPSLQFGEVSYAGVMVMTKQSEMDTALQQRWKRQIILLMVKREQWRPS